MCVALDEVIKLLIRAPVLMKGAGMAAHAGRKIPLLPI